MAVVRRSKAGGAIRKVAAAGDDHRSNEDGSDVPSLRRPAPASSRSSVSDADAQAARSLQPKSAQLRNSSPIGGPRRAMIACPARAAPSMGATDGEAVLNAVAALRLPAAAESRPSRTTRHLRSIPQNVDDDVAGGEAAVRPRPDHRRSRPRQQQRASPAAQPAWTARHVRAAEHHPRPIPVAMGASQLRGGPSGGVKDAGPALATRRRIHHRPRRRVPARIPLRAPAAAPVPSAGSVPSPAMPSPVP